MILCGLLFANSSLCYDLLGNDITKAAFSGLEEADVSEITEITPDNGQEIAIPPIIRPPSAELPSFIPDDFVVSRQTPYDSGRNEIVVTSPSTDTTQRFWVSLPGEEFQLYEVELTDVSVNNAEQIVSSVDAQTTSAEVAQRLQSFKANFENSVLSEITLADGTKAEFSETQVTIRQPDGRAVETIIKSQSDRNTDTEIAHKNQQKFNKLIAQANSSCESNTAKEIVKEATDIEQWSTAIAAEWSSDLSWQDALATRLIYQASAALAHTLKEATSGSVALQKVTCKEPVQCGFRRDTRAEGISGSQIITDLFRVPSGAEGDFKLEYEFFQVPDRLEISYNGEIKHDFGPTGGSGEQSFSLSQVTQGFVGIRVIGNPDQSTEWWYEIACSCPTELDSTDDPVANTQSDWARILNITNQYYQNNSSNSAVSAFAYQMRTLANGSHNKRKEVGGWAGDFTRNTLLEAVNDIDANEVFWQNPPETGISFWESQFGYYCDNAPDIDITDPNNNSLSEHDCGFARSGEHHFDRHLVPAFKKHVSSTLLPIVENNCLEDKVSEILSALNELESEHSLLLNSVLVPGLDTIPGVSLALRYFAASGIPERAIDLRENTIQEVLKDFLSQGKISQKDFSELESTLDF